MDAQTRLKLVLEAFAWLATAIIAGVVFLPIFNNLTTFPFWFPNLVFIVVFITYTRYIFLLKHTFLARMNLLKVALIFASIPLIFYMVNSIHSFRSFIDEEGQEAFFALFKERSNYNQEVNILNYISSEYTLFGVAAIISAILLPIRMLISIWRLMNKGTV